jgi:hypothetical protein
LSGRRRFTSQRLVLYAVLASQQQDGAAAIAQEALALFRGAHKSLLTDGDGLPGVFCPELEQAYFGKLQGDRAITAFADLAERTLRAIAKDASDSAELLADWCASPRRRWPSSTRSPASTKNRPSCMRA